MASRVRPPRWNGGNTPRRSSACRQSCFGHPGQPGPQQPVTDAPQFQAVQVDRQRVGRVVLLEPDPHVQPLPQEPLGRVGEQRDQFARSMSRAAAAGSGAAETPERAGRGPAAALAPRSAVGSKVNGPARPSVARCDGAGVVGLQRMLDQDLAPGRSAGRRRRGVVERVQQFTQWHRGGRRAPVRSSAPV